MGSVLIVDDNEDLRYSLSNVVKREGFGVETAADGRQALETINSTVIDLIFLDIGLPDIDGISLFQSSGTVAPTSASSCSPASTMRRLPLNR